MSQMTKILVVDDERVIADTLAMILCDAGYDCMAAYSGEEALRRAAELNPALVLTDVIMPGLNGLELAVRLRANAPDCEILLFSGNATTQDLLDLARGEGHRFELLPKPIPARTLLAKISSMA
jgi:CheY-like chemotaxis protein